MVILFKNEDGYIVEPGHKLKRRKMIDDIVILYGETKLPVNDCKVVFKDKFKKEHTVEISRLIQVFNNNIWENKKSVK
tara:strand:+ start:419 stop:652 length:234 start_codon:yes stop_codon:yes gene_type:complete